MSDSAFADLLAANARYAAEYDQDFDGIAHAGVLMITCMDSRIDPLAMIGVDHGDAKIIRTPGGRVTASSINGCIVGVHLLEVTRILVVPHTQCMMARGDDAFVAEQVRQATGADLGDLRLGADPNQLGRLADDVALLRGHPLIVGRAIVGGFLYDVRTGLLDEVL